MLSERAVARMLLVCLLAAALSSCVVRRRVITRDGRNTRQALLVADEDQLLARLVKQYAAVHDFTATVDMVPALGTTEKSKVTEYKDIRGYILFRRPADIRIIGLYPVVRNKAFDMVSDEQGFRLFIPAKNRFVTGASEIITPSENKLENLRPQHFLEALIVRPADPKRERPALENHTDEDDAAYLLHLVHVSDEGDVRLTRTIWFSRLDLSLARQLIYDTAGNILTDARYRDWQIYDGVPFPKQVEINRPRDEYAVVLNIVKIEVNKGITDDKFVLEQPEGTVLQVLGAPPQTPPAPADKKKKK
jgi:outer membrane lipoprotein-sorting protein